MSPAPFQNHAWLDTQAKIQAAIDRLGSTGGEIELAPTTIPVSQAGTATGDTLTTPYAFHIDPSYGDLRIYGSPGSKLFTTAGAPANMIPLLIRGSSATKRTSKTLLENFEIDGNIANVTAWVDFGVVTVAYADYVTLRGLTVVNAPFTGLLVFRDSQQAKVEHNHVTGDAAAEDPLRIESAQALIQFNTVIGPTGTLTHPLIGLGNNTDVDIYARGVVVANNVMVLNGAQTGVALAGTQGCVIAHNTIQDQTNAASSQGISLIHDAGGIGYDCYDNVVMGNTIYSVRNGIMIATGTATLGTHHNKIMGNLVIGGLAADGFTVNAGTGIGEYGTTNVDYNEFTDNLVQGFTTNYGISGAHEMALSRGNIGMNSAGATTYRTSNRGTSAVASGTTSIAVTHSLGYTPTVADIRLTPTNNLGNASRLWVSAVSSTTFTVSTDVDPGASTAAFGWSVG